jgi:hypothetical protein
LATLGALALFAVMGQGLAMASSHGTAATAATAHATRADHSGLDWDDLLDLLKVYRLTAPFHDADKAIAAGWTEEPMCMDYPDGYLDEPPGAMGHHFFNVPYITDGGRIDPEEPELVIYEKRADGRWRLNAVEYLIPARDHPGTAPPPVLFGEEFTWHPDVGTAGVWGLHVWLWRYNPHGFFASVNPNVSCEHADHADHGH